MPEKLSKYKSKRKFGKTPEPEESPQSTSGRSYVIQKHDATRLHYDFRLEHAGVLLSWAVPKGPSLDPGVKRLAVHVEDHPVSYGSFEGTIPEGNYGAGTVEIWDSGTWEPLGDVDDMMSKGEMKLLLHGRRLTGKWVLVQMNKNEKDWLLIKEKDEFAKPGDEEGVVERSITPHGKPIDFRAIHPQLATLAERAPTGDDWIHEIKYDGYRLLAWHLDGKVHLITRGGLDWKDKFQEIADAVKQYVPEGTGLDGEVVVFSDQGVSDFGGLQHWLSNGEGNDPQYMIFDLLAINGHEMMSMPLLERKDRLKSMIDAFPKEASYWLRYSDHVQGHGDSMAGEACRKGLEGIISKSARSRYVQARTDTWLKTKCTHQEEFVIGGYTEPGGEREGFGSLLLGQYDSKGNLRYAGRVGTGFDDVLLRSLQKRLAKLERPTSPFVDHSETDGLKAWVEPKLVAQVRYTERTKSGTLRHPAFLGLREDKQAEEVTPEKTMKDLAVKISHPDKVLFEDSGITKLGVARYYDQIWERMEPWISDRPLAIVRCPDGPGKTCFFQKHKGPGMPDNVEVSVKGEEEPLLVAKDKNALLSLVQFGALEFHAWASRFESIEEPDLMTLDLDPGPGVKWSTVIEASKVMAEYVRHLGFIPFLKISGGKGVHVVVPIKRGSTDWTGFKEFAHATVLSLDKMVPRQFVTVSSKAKREGRIFLDYLRNGRGATAIVPFSVRANPEASVAIPLDWGDLDSVDNPRQFTVENVETWLPLVHKNPWKDLWKSARAINEKSWKLVGFDRAVD